MDDHLQPGACRAAVCRPASSINTAHTVHQVAQGCRLEPSHLPVGAAVPSGACSLLPAMRRAAGPLASTQSMPLPLLRVLSPAVMLHSACCCRCRPAA